MVGPKIKAKNVIGKRGLGTKWPIGQRADTIKLWINVGEKKRKMRASQVGRLSPYDSRLFWLGPSNYLSTLYFSNLSWEDFLCFWFVNIFIMPGKIDNPISIFLEAICIAMNMNAQSPDTYIPHKSAPRTTKPHTHTFWIRMGLQYFDQNESCRH